MFKTKFYNNQGENPQNIEEIRRFTQDFTKDIEDLR